MTRQGRGGKPVSAPVYRTRVRPALRAREAFPRWEKTPSGSSLEYTGSQGVKNVQI